MILQAWHLAGPAWFCCTTSIHGQPRKLRVFASAGPGWPDIASGKTDWPVGFWLIDKKGPQEPLDLLVCSTCFCAEKSMAWPGEWMRPAALCLALCHGLGLRVCRTNQTISRLEEEQRIACPWLRSVQRKPNAGCAAARGNSKESDPKTRPEPVWRAGTFAG